MLIPVQQALQRVEQAKSDSDVAFFYDLLHTAEMVFKLATAGLVACLDDDRDRHRYRLEYELVRADGLGGWSRALDDALTGPASQVLSDGARGAQRELTQNFRLGGTEWQAAAARELFQARLALDSDIANLPAKVSGRRWFSDFVALRNRTRGHGATTPRACSDACVPLASSLSLLLDNFSLLRQPWVFLRRNLSGKYRVVDLGNGSDGFGHLVSSRGPSLPDGVHLNADGPRAVHLLTTDQDARDFFLPNGGATDRQYELLSYVTDSRLAADISPYTAPPTALPPSDTEGVGELRVVGNAFTNLPVRAGGYVRRPDLEDEVKEVVLDDRHPVITLSGRGGIGKTSLALEVTSAVAALDRFFAMVWFSARDIDLLMQGPKLVRPQVLTPEDMAKEFVDLMEPEEASEKGFKAVDYLAAALTSGAGGPTLFVFDNFETVRHPLELYRWIDTYVRLPNKVLITTRSRDFKGDYWLEVGGMTEAEFHQLVGLSAGQLGIRELVTPEYEAELYRESDGHPYIAKVLLGELARAGKRRRVERVVASQGQVLEALFERTYSNLSPAAQRIFLTLSNWRSLVPEVALDAAVNRPENERLDVEAAVDELRRSSLLEVTETDASTSYLSVPLSAALFGRRKITTSAWKPAIEADAEFLRLFGPVRADGVGRGFEEQVGRLFRTVAERVSRDPSQFGRYQPILEFVAHEQPIGWVLLAQLLEEQQPVERWRQDAVDAYRRYLEAVPDDAQIWRALARSCTVIGDYTAAAQALVARAQLASAPFADVSYAAARVNTYLYDGLLELDTEAKRVLIGSLVDAMERRRSEADATDFSRMAWLLLNSNRPAEARKAVEDGLTIDSSNSHCIKLAARLNVTVPV